MKKIVLVTAFFISTLSGFAGLNSGSLNSTKLDNPVGKEPMALQPLWPAVSHLAFQKALDVSGVGFSFTFAGETVGPTISQSWRVSGEKRGHSQITTFRHSSGLTVRREVTAFPDYGAIEYTLRFKNESSTTLNELGPIQALDLIFDRQVVPGVSVVSSGGGGCEASYPPADFAIQRRDLKSPVMLTTWGGRSSNKDLPFFFIDNDSLKEGLYVAVGWSGQWTAETKLENGRLHLTACIPGLQIRLQPGEEISGPRMLIGGYHGALAEGSNR
ncbi:MAG: hypothetical protein Q8914_14175, partial [Bacteroidota bacterium]|nr:hypothetical protein [Bacteroidota bacterium]